MQTYVKHLGYKNVGRRGASSVKSHLKYMEQRKNEHGEKEKRELYNHSDNVERINFYKEMDNVNRGVLAHKLVISMDGKTNKEQNIDLKELTRRTISKFEQKHNCKLNWVACNHEGKNPHSHIIILGKDSNDKKVYIMPKHLRQLKSIADKERKLMYERNVERIKIEPVRQPLEFNKSLEKQELLKRERELKNQIEQVKKLKNKLKSNTSKAYKDLDKQEKTLEGNLEDVKSKQKLDKTFNHIDKQLDHEQQLEKNMKSELTKNMRQDLDKEIDKTVEKSIEDVLQHELTRDRGLGR